MQLLVVQDRPRGTEQFEINYCFYFEGSCCESV